jgi:hypothetical protein
MSWLESRRRHNLRKGIKGQEGRGVSNDGEGYDRSKRKVAEKK